nr:hypothetical protein [Tanacetum cinerariifolium]
MVAASMKHMALNFAKLDKFKGVDFRRCQKKMHFLLSSMIVVYVLTTPILKDGDDAIVKQLRKRANVTSSKELQDSLEAKYMADDTSNFKHTLKHLKEELTLVELGSHLRIKESLRVQDSDKSKGNKISGLSVVNMVEHTTPSVKAEIFRSCCVRWTDGRVQESLDSATSTNVLLVCISFDLWTDFVAIDGVDVIFELIRILARQILRFAVMAG